MHECKRIFSTQQIDKCTGSAFNRCYGDSELILELWFMDQDGTECFYDNWVEEKVNFCPYCGYQPERSKREDSEHLIINRDVKDEVIVHKGPITFIC
jgi:hypothetical protein